MDKKSGIVLCACALAGAAVALWIAGGFAVASEAVYPLEKSATWFQRNVTCRIRTLWRRQNYGFENAQLRRENALLRMALQDAEQAAAAARQPSDEQVMPSASWIPAPVLSRGGSTGAKNFLRIGKGSSSGVVKGAPVAVPDGLVGIVSEVSLHTCTVLLISDPAVKVSCELEMGDPALGLGDGKAVLIAPADIDHHQVGLVAGQQHVPVQLAVGGGGEAVVIQGAGAVGVHGGAGHEAHPQALRLQHPIHTGGGEVLPGRPEGDGRSGG